MIRSALIQNSEDITIYEKELEQARAKRNTANRQISEIQGGCRDSVLRYLTPSDGGTNRESLERIANDNNAIAQEYARKISALNEDSFRQVKDHLIESDNGFSDLVQKEDTLINLKDKCEKLEKRVKELLYTRVNANDINAELEELQGDFEIDFGEVPGTIHNIDASSLPLVQHNIILKGISYFSVHRKQKNIQEIQNKIILLLQGLNDKLSEIQSEIKAAVESGENDILGADSV